LFGENTDFDLTRFSNEGDSEVREVVDKLPAPGKISAKRDFDIGEGIPQGNQTISQKVDAREIGIRKNFCPDGALQDEGAGNPRLAA